MTIFGHMGDARLPGHAAGRRNSRGINMIGFMAAMVVGGVGLAVVLSVVSAVLPKRSSTTTRSAAAAPAATPPAPAPFDPTPLFVTLGTIAAVVVALVVAFVVVRRLLAARSAGLANAATWAALRKRKQQLMVEWSKYETDVALMIDYPVMTDYTDPVVHKVIVAMQQVRNAEIAHHDDRKAPAEDSPLQAAVDEFELAFHAAENYARRLGATRLDRQEQRRLTTARQALNIILDGSSPASEVQAAYRSLRSNLKGIIDLPQQAVAELESCTRLELESA